MLYILKLYDNKNNLIIEGAYSSQIQAEMKANTYLKIIKDQFAYYDIQETELDKKELLYAAK